MRTYVAVYLGAFVLAMLITPRTARLARAAGVMDIPGVRRVHRDPTPRLGGIALVLATLIMLMIVLLVDNAIGRAFRGGQTQLIAVVVGSLLVLLAGTMDDIRGLSVSAKLAFEIAAALLVCALGVRIGSISVAGITLAFGWFSWPLTMLWIVGVTNALNLIDGIDGLAAGIALIACAATAFLAVYLGQPVMAVLMLALSGSLSGFLMFNFHPARVFLGDGGSLFLGFAIAAGSVMSATKSAALLGLGLPVLALAVPICDTFFSMLRRALTQRSIVAPDRGHIHHRLLKMGASQTQAAALIWLLTLAFTGVGVFMFVKRGMIPLLVYCCVAALLMAVFWIAGTLPLRQCLTHLRRRLRVNHEAKGQRRQYEQAALYFEEAASFDGWWRSACTAADQMGFTGLRMRWPCDDGSAQSLLWAQPGTEARADQTAHVRVPVLRQHLGPPVWLECDVAIGSSLESASRRMMLFSRLLEEYSPADLPSDGATPGSAGRKAGNSGGQDPRHAKPAHTQSATPR
ncbi:MAG: undecaprenyl/decaprenyl-phosphate alpha-N-acetylglucosaminyl 1-phosphate transferase [Verrucomicrobia bacterium]|nr:undecaprenyl/decaprenyl-phosphate alpha-N-acetylglucosaminyl 1-phosphate transferase [Verrucomicrobiota bacterium]